MVMRETLERLEKLEAHLIEEKVRRPNVIIGSGTSVSTRILVSVYIGGAGAQQLW